MSNIKFALFISKNMLIVMWWKMLRYIGILQSTEPIPTGCYCYSEENCKYYKHLGFGYNACGYLGTITDDLVFDDQCKICNEKFENN